MACAIGRDREAGIALLATTPYSPDERSKVGSLLRAGTRCLRQRDPVATIALLARGATAEALYETLFAAPAEAQTPPLRAAPLPRPAAGAEARIVEVLTPMYSLVDCATPRDPGLVRALLATEPGSSEEGTALSAFNPAFTACVAAGTQLRIDPRIMRAFFAESLYRWSVVQRDGAAAPYGVR